MALGGESALEGVVPLPLDRIGPENVAEDELAIPGLAPVLDEVDMVRPGLLHEEQPSGPVLAPVLVAQALHRGDF